MQVSDRISTSPHLPPQHFHSTQNLIIHEKAIRNSSLIFGDAGDHQFLEHLYKAGIVDETFSLRADVVLPPIPKLGQPEIIKLVNLLLKKFKLHVDISDKMKEEIICQLKSYGTSIDSTIFSKLEQTRSLQFTLSELFFNLLDYSDRKIPQASKNIEIRLIGSFVRYILKDWFKEAMISLGIPETAIPSSDIYTNLPSDVDIRFYPNNDSLDLHEINAFVVDLLAAKWAPQNEEEITLRIYSFILLKTRTCFLERFGDGPKDPKVKQDIVDKIAIGNPPDIDLMFVRDLLFDNLFSTDGISLQIVPFLDAILSNYSPTYLSIFPASSSNIECWQSIVDNLGKLIRINHKELEKIKNSLIRFVVSIAKGGRSPNKISTILFNIMALPFASLSEGERIKSVVDQVIIDLIKYHKKHNANNPTLLIAIILAMIQLLKNEGIPLKDSNRIWDEVSCFLFNYTYKNNVFIQIYKAFKDCPHSPELVWAHLQIGAFYLLNKLNQSEERLKVYISQHEKSPVIQIRSDYTLLLPFNLSEAFETILNSAASFKQEAVPSLIALIKYFLPPPFDHSSPQISQNFNQLFPNPEDLDKLESLARNLIQNRRISPILKQLGYLFLISCQSLKPCPNRISFLLEHVPQILNFDSLHSNQNEILVHFKRLITKTKEFSSKVKVELLNHFQQSIRIEGASLETVSLNWMRSLANSQDPELAKLSVNIWINFPTELSNTQKSSISLALFNGILLQNPNQAYLLLDFYAKESCFNKGEYLKLFIKIISRIPFENHTILDLARLKKMAQALFEEPIQLEAFDSHEIANFFQNLLKQEPSDENRTLFVKAIQVGAISFASKDTLLRLDEIDLFHQFVIAYKKTQCTPSITTQLIIKATQDLFIDEKPLYHEQMLSEIAWIIQNLLNNTKYLLVKDLLSIVENNEGFKEAIRNRINATIREHISKNNGLFERLTEVFKDVLSEDEYFSYAINQLEQDTRSRNFLTAFPLMLKVAKRFEKETQKQLMISFADQLFERFHDLRIGDLSEIESTITSGTFSKLIIETPEKKALYLLNVTNWLIHNYQPSFVRFLILFTNQILKETTRLPTHKISQEMIRKLVALIVSFLEKRSLESDPIVIGISKELKLALPTLLNQLKEYGLVLEMCHLIKLVSIQPKTSPPDIHSEYVFWASDRLLSDFPTNPTCIELVHTILGLSKYHRQGMEAIILKNVKTYIVLIECLLNEKLSPANLNAKFRENAATWIKRLFQAQSTSKMRFLENPLLLNWAERIRKQNNASILEQLLDNISFEEAIEVPSYVRLRLYLARLYLDDPIHASRVLIRDSELLKKHEPEGYCSIVKKLVTPLLRVSTSESTHILKKFIDQSSLSFDRSQAKLAFETLIKFIPIEEFLDCYLSSEMDKMLQHVPADYVDCWIKLVKALSEIRYRYLVVIIEELPTSPIFLNPSLEQFQVLMLKELLKNVKDIKTLPILDALLECKKGFSKPIKPQILVELNAAIAKRHLTEIGLSSVNYVLGWCQEIIPLENRTPNSELFSIPIYSFLFDTFIVLSSILEFEAEGKIADPESKKLAKALLYDCIFASDNPFYFIEIMVTSHKALQKQGGRVILDILDKFPFLSEEKQQQLRSSFALSYLNIFESLLRNHNLTLLIKECSIHPQISFILSPGALAFLKSELNIRLLVSKMVSPVTNCSNILSIIKELNTGFSNYPPSGSKSILYIETIFDQLFTLLTKFGEKLTVENIMKIPLSFMETVQALSEPHSFPNIPQPLYNYLFQLQRILMNCYPIIFSDNDKSNEWKGISKLPNVHPLTFVCQSNLENHIAYLLTFIEKCLQKRSKSLLSNFYIVNVMNDVLVYLITHFPNEHKKIVPLFEKYIFCEHSLSDRFYLLHLSNVQELLTLFLKCKEFDFRKTYPKTAALAFVYLRDISQAEFVTKNITNEEKVFLENFITSVQEVNSNLFLSSMVAIVVSFLPRHTTLDWSNCYKPLLRFLEKQPYLRVFQINLMQRTVKLSEQELISFIGEQVVVAYAQPGILNICQVVAEACFKAAENKSVKFMGYLFQFLQNTLKAGCYKNQYSQLLGQLNSSLPMLAKLLYCDDFSTVKEKIMRIFPKLLLPSQSLSEVEKLQRLLVINKWITIHLREENAEYRKYIQKFFNQYGGTLFAGYPKEATAIRALIY